MIKPRPKKAGKHLVEEYKAISNTVLCNCGFFGTLEEYNQHRIENNSQLARSKYKSGAWA